MKTNLAYIHDTVNAALDREHANPVLPEKERVEIRQKSLKPIAGFHLHDAAAEQKLREKRLAERRKRVEVFNVHKRNLVERCEAVGVAPLAIIPLGAWNQLCQRAGLYRFETDGAGRVMVTRGWASEFIVYDRGQYPNYPKSAAKMNAYLAKGDWGYVLGKMFPDKIGRPWTLNNSGQSVTVVLPEPPADVAEILLKVQSFKLKTATVAEAVGFKETPEQLLKSEVARITEEIRYREWLRTDPIVYTEEGTAAAILAQFGEFPVEQQLVDEVVNSEHLVTEERATVVASATYGGTGGMVPSAPGPLVPMGDGSYYDQRTGARYWPNGGVHPMQQVGMMGGGGGMFTGGPGGMLGRNG